MPWHCTDIKGWCVACHSCPLYSSCSDEVASNCKKIDCLFCSLLGADLP